MIDVIASMYESEAKLTADVAAFAKEREDFKFTEGVPAPWPPNELVELIVNTGGTFNWIEPEPVVEPEPIPKPEIPIDKQREYRFREETDALFMSACEDFTIGSSGWLAAIEAWKAEKEKIRLACPYPE